jgi:3-oxoadipate enol-lactonase
VSRTGTLVTLDGCRVAFTAYGDPGSPALLLSNSLGATQTMWHDQIEAFSAHFHTVTYDTRGHGGSDTPAGAYSLDRLGRDVVDLLDHLGIERSHFCGISLGGMTGQWLAAHAAERFNRLVLAHTSAFMPPAEAWQDRIVTVLASGVSEIADAVAARWVTPQFRYQNPDFFAQLIQKISDVDPVGYAGCASAIRDMDLRPVLSSISLDCLVIAGLKDVATPLEHSQFLAGHIEGAELVTTDGAHLSNLECIDEFNQHVMRFLLRD